MNGWEKSKNRILKEINLTNKSIIDIGCGNGWFLSWCSNYISQGIGIDPSSSQITIAKQKIKNLNIKFKLLSAEKIKNINENFDLIFFFNSLHHIPEELMLYTLSKCSECMHNHSIICIVEPLAEGTFFQFMKDIDDESKVRSTAYQSIINCNKANLQIKNEFFFDEKKVFKDPVSCINSILLADKNRTSYINKNKENIISKFYLLSDFNNDNKYEFTQPMRINLLRLKTDT